jgi:pseudouridine-5'-monophosphatase
MCIATSSSLESFAMKSTNHKELFRQFSHIVLGASDKEVKNGKPAPDIFEIAARRFEESPDARSVSLK